MSWVKRLQEKWELTSFWQFLIVMVVFACTGFTVVFIKGPIIDLITGGGEREWWMTILYFIIILPIYYTFLLFYGFVFGQFKFFWGFTQRTMKRFGIGKPAEDSPSQ